MADKDAGPGLFVQTRKKKMEIRKNVSALDEMRTTMDAIINDAGLSMEMQKTLKSMFSLFMEEMDRMRDDINSFQQMVTKLVEEKRVLSERNKALEDENSQLKEEVLMLKNSNIVHEEQKKQTPNGNVATKEDERLTYEEVERSRSLVISGIPESRKQKASSRDLYDWDCIITILDYLDIPCKPVAVYRLGKMNNYRHRLIKVIMPASYFKKEVLRRAYLLKNFPEPGIFVRSSLSRSERELIRERRRTHLSTSGRPSGIDARGNRRTSNISNVVTVDASTSVTDNINVSINAATGNF